MYSSNDAFIAQKSRTIILSFAYVYNNAQLVAYSCDFERIEKLFLKKLFRTACFVKQIDNQLTLV